MDRISSLKGLLLENPKDPFLHYALALEYVKCEQFILADGCFENCLLLDENYVAGYYHYAKLLNQTHNKPKALEIVKKGKEVALAINDKHTYQELLFLEEDIE